MVYLQYERIIRFHHEPGKGHYIIYFTLNERAVQKKLSDFKNIVTIFHHIVTMRNENYGLPDS